jgi:tetratricopeptide (TPR) repeat protein
MRSMKLLALALALASSSSAPGAGPRVEVPRRLFTQSGGLGGGTVADDGTLSIQLWEPRVRYRIPRPSEAKQAALIAVLRKAQDERLSITVRFDAAGARIQPDAATIEFPACSLAVADLRFEVEPGCAAGRPSSAGGDAALGIAYGYQAEEGYAAAARMLAAAGTPAGAGAHRVLVWLRSRNAAGLAQLEGGAGTATDRLRVAALSDYRELARLEPDDQDHLFAISSMLEDLGAYREAMATLDEILARWPDEKFRVLIRKGAVSRSSGDYFEALGALDRLVAELGPQDGMRYHYHRGWTLSLLKRFPEAAAEYSEGLKSQPDYSSAFIRRGCAYASLGRLRDSIADLERGKALLQALPGGGSGRIAADIRDAEADRRRVAQALAAGGERPVAGTCGAPGWTFWERPRPRSPLLAQP